MSKILSICFIVLLLVGTQSHANTIITLNSESGGEGGTPFVEMVAPNGVISKITIRSGKFIDSIQLTYQYKQEVPGKIHGGSGGSLKSFSLSRGEYITEFGGRSGKYVDSIYVKTNKGRQEHWGGDGGGKPFRFMGTRQSPIQGIWGRAGVFLDAIGIIRKIKSTNLQNSRTKSSINNFKPSHFKTVNMGQGIGKDDSVTDPHFPTENMSKFLKLQNNRLYLIVKSLSQSSDEFDSYINRTEYSHCHGNIFCEVDTRTDLISNIMGIR